MHSLLWDRLLSHTVAGSGRERSPRGDTQDTPRALRAETGGPKGSPSPALVPWESASLPTLKKTEKMLLCAKDSSDTEMSH